MKVTKGDESFPGAYESIKSLSDVTTELQNTIDDKGAYFPDVDVVIRSLKVVDEFLMQDEPNIHEIYHDNGELIEVMFLGIGSRAKSYLHTSLKWMEVYECLSSLDAKLQKVFKDTEYETRYSDYSITFAGGGSSPRGGISFRQGSGGRVMPLVMSPPLDHGEIREYIKANMLLSEFFWLCDFILGRDGGKEILDAFVIDMTNRAKSRFILVGPDHVKETLNKWEKCKQEQEKYNTK